MHSDDLPIFIKGIRRILLTKTRSRNYHTEELTTDEAAQFKRILARQLQVLSSERWQSIICMRFGLRGQAEHSRKDVADAFGISYDRIRQIQHRAITLMARHTPGWPAWILAEDYTGN